MRHRMSATSSTGSLIDVRATPPDLFAALDAEFHFETDVCALPGNAKCARYFSPEVDGLWQEWTGACFMNPPYGTQIGALNRLKELTPQSYPPPRHGKHRRNATGDTGAACS